MTDLLTAAQMRAVERAAIDSGEVTGLELMERAGAGVVEAIFEWRPELAEGDRRAVVLCGPGNNGGDGFVVARLLKQQGWAVEVFLYGDEAKLPPDAAENCRRWREMGEVGDINDGWVMPHAGTSCDLAIDALFGTGLSRPMGLPPWVTEQFVEVFDNYFDEIGFPAIVSIDMPSGTCSDSARFLHDAKHFYPSDCIFADLTVTFHRPRIGHFLNADFTNRGRLSVKDIGLPSSTTSGTAELVCSVSKATKAEIDHKYTHGHALIVSGGMARSGAARLAARGALRIGAGLVTVASPPSALMENAAHLTAIMLRKMKGAEGLAEILEDERINAVVIGPGCGVGDETRALVEATLSRAKTRDPLTSGEVKGGPGSSLGQRKRTVVLDADALTSYAGDPAALFAAIKASPYSVILTPHGGEFGRLFPDIAAKLAETPTKGPAYSKVDATREAAALSGATVLYKGADTVIAQPDGRCSIAAAVYERAAPWLATAGSGDVLAGMIAGLAARAIHDPAASAAWLHQECGRHLGPGLIAEDIPEAIPSVLKRVLGWKAPAES